MPKLKEIDVVSIRLASPEKILEWSRGELKKPETINYRTLKPERDGLFCEKIFGPSKDWECYCGKYKKPRFRGHICEKCGVEVTHSRVRRERMGHIHLASPVCHIWYVKGIPGRISSLLNVSAKELEKVVYYINFIVTFTDKKKIEKYKSMIEEAMELEVEEIKVEADKTKTATETIEVGKILEIDLAKFEVAEKVSIPGQRKGIAKKGEKLSQAMIEAMIEGKAYTFKVKDEEGSSQVIQLPEWLETIMADKEVVEDVVDEETGEVLVQKGDAVDIRAAERILDHAVKELEILDIQREALNEARKNENLRRIDELRAAFTDLLPGLTEKSLLTESEYRRLMMLGEVIEKHFELPSSDLFLAEMGAGAVKKLLLRVDLKKEEDEIREVLTTATGAKRAKLIKRLSVIRSFVRSGNKPEWMILENLPVIPPELRPMVQLEGGRFAASDLNDLYRRVINRNNRLKRLIDIKAPESIIRNEKRMLQEAVDALIDNGRRGKAVTGSNNRPLKSLSDLLKGKQGRFRQNLLGKRVDYSGRSVIVVGPELKLHQCGLPKVMALEFFKPFVLKKLVDKGYAAQIKAAKLLVEQMDPRVWDVLDEVIQGKPVLLNRAPTLHRLGIQAFEPVLIDGKAIRIHPLVCQAFNADFDGDQMAVHLPLSIAAQSEARLLMLSSNNILLPADGHPIVGPTQDMIIGVYYLTIIKDNDEAAKFEAIYKSRISKLKREDIEGLKFFSDEDELKLAYDLGEIGLHKIVLVRITKNTMTLDSYDKLVPLESRVIATTMGRVFMNSVFPPELPFYNMKLSKSEVGDIIGFLYKRFGVSITVDVLDNLKDLSFLFATKAGITISIDDVFIPPNKWKIIGKAEKDVEKILKEYDNGKITDEERHTQVVDRWNKCTKDLTNTLNEQFDKMNPVYQMSVSGARGKIDQVRQLCAWRGLMAAPTGETIELPIKANLREGLGVLEYFISTHGARKGLADTALRTADSGYLTRRLVDVAQDVVVIEDDCGTTDFVEIGSTFEKGKLVQTISERVLGRFCAENIIEEETGEIIVKVNQMIDEDIAAKIEQLDLPTVKCRSILSCGSPRGICRMCYGRDLATGRMVEIGAPVGIIAAQSIGEPGTQLTMRTFHTGGVAGDDITKGLPQVELLFELFDARYQRTGAIITPITGTVEFAEPNLIIVRPRAGSKIAPAIFKREDFTGKHVGVEEGDKVKKGQPLTKEALVNPREFLKVRGVRDTQLFLVQEVQSIYKSQGVNTNDKHIEVIVRQMLKFVKVISSGDSNYLEGDLVERYHFKEVVEALEKSKKTPPEAEPVLLGISKASLSTESFLSAASFQETTKVLTNAAIEGKTDYLRGLKENVIIGRLVPVGTGRSRMRYLYPHASDKKPARTGGNSNPVDDD